MHVHLYFYLLVCFACLPILSCLLFFFSGFAGLFFLVFCFFFRFRGGGDFCLSRAELLKPPPQRDWPKPPAVHARHGRRFGEGRGGGTGDSTVAQVLCFLPTVFYTWHRIPSNGQKYNPSFRYYLRGTIIIRTCDQHKYLYITVFLRAIFGPDYYVPPY